MNNQAIKQLALELIKTHKLSDWHFAWTDARNRFGSCNYKTHTIALSKPLTLLNSEAQAKDTILHEIAHALAGHEAHHSKAWQDMCVSIGAKSERCYSSAVIQPKARYIATCKHCGHAHLYNRKMRVSCSHCSPRFNKRYLMKFTKNR
jgi:predicted SprT family Zn-dependent metalloprotease